MRFFEYLKKQEPSKENEEARKRIYKLHQLEGSLTYIERMEIIEEGKGSMEVEFVRGELSEGMTLKEKNLEEERFSKFILEREKIKGDSQNKGIRGRSYLNIGSQ